MEYVPLAFSDFGKGSCASWEQLVERIDSKRWRLITIPLSLTKKNGISTDPYIVRSIVPGMVPISFGYNETPYGIKRIYEVLKQWGKGGRSYKSLTKFPHPYT